MFYVYEWYDCDTNEIFYVGKGCRRRYKVRQHNALFNFFIATKNCKSRIIKEFETEKEAFDYEFQRIKELKEQGQCQCNIHKGGFGGSTSWWNDEYREQYSKNNVMKNEAQRERMSKNNPMKNPQTAKIVTDQKKRHIILDGEEYDCAGDIAKLYGRSPNSVMAWARNGYSPDGKYCHFKDQPKKENWEVLYAKRHNTNSRQVAVDGIIFDKVKDAAYYIKCNTSALIRKLQKNEPYKGHICKYVNQQPSRTNFGNSSAEGSTTNE